MHGRFFAASPRQLGLVLEPPSPTIIQWAGIHLVLGEPEEHLPMTLLGGSEVLQEPSDLGFLVFDFEEERRKALTAARFDQSADQEAVDLEQLWARSVDPLA